jgi:hypothetical protein
VAVPVLMALPEQINAGPGSEHRILSLDLFLPLSATGEAEESSNQTLKAVMLPLLTAHFEARQEPYALSNHLLDEGHSHQMQQG